MRIPIRPELVLLLDTLCISSAVDLLTNSRTPDTPPSAVLVPFYVVGPPLAALLSVSCAWLHRPPPARHPAVRGRRGVPRQRHRLRRQGRTRRRLHPAVRTHPRRSPGRRRVAPARLHLPPRPSGRMTEERPPMTTSDPHDYDTD